MIYEVKKIPSRLSGKITTYTGTIKELNTAFKGVLRGYTPRKIETLVKALNDTQKGKEGTYTHAVYTYDILKGDSANE